MPISARKALVVAIIAGMVGCSSSTAGPTATSGSGSTGSSGTFGSSQSAAASSGTSSSAVGAISSGPLASASSGPSGATGASSTGVGTVGGSSRGSTGSTGSTGIQDAGPGAPLPDGGPNPLITARPYHSSGPQGYDPTKPLPLILLLHGYGATASLEGSYMGIEAQENALQFFYAAPDGTTNPAGLEFWNATDACCNFYGSTVDDVAYLTAVIQDMQARYPIDPKRIFIVGHSNGGFMAHRMACDRASMIAAILSLAGAQWENPANCAPSEPVTVVELHGTADTTIAYGGGTIAQGDGGLVAFPSAPQTVATWASKNGCSTVITDAGPTYNFDQLIPGNQTTVERYSDCPMGDVELWSILGGPHIPDLGGDWPGAPLGFLLAHPKP